MLFKLLKYTDEQLKIFHWDALGLFVILQAAIRKELNEFKSTEMEVHASSKHLTRSVCKAVSMLFLDL